MTYYYHYTTRDGFNGIKRGHNASQNGGYFPEGAGIFWACRAEQPQKSSWYSKQHDKGFYLTNLPPRKMTNKISAQMGINQTVHNLFVFVFRANRNAINGRTVKNYKNTQKYYITTTRLETDDIIQIGDGGAVWCGPVAKCPAEIAG